VSRIFGVAGLQLWVSAKGGNIEYLATRVDQLMHAFPWVRMVLFSELAACGPVHANAESLPGPTDARFREIAQKHELWVVTGSVYERAEGKIFNTCSVFDPTGSVIARYRKIFPFAPFSVGTEPGNEFCVFDVPEVGRFGISICYDLWFPEHSRTLVAMGAEVILHPALTPTIDREVELPIARATAVMNQCYVIDINGAGGGGAGRSSLVGPEGDVIHQAGPNEELIPVELDLDRVSRSRERGVLTLGQPLKSFRDSPVRFDVYDPKSPLRSYLNGLGPVRKPSRLSPALPGQSLQSTKKTRSS
jgi:predicted amidohydrolase